MKSPWTTVLALDPDTDYVALASSIPPKSIGSTWKLFRGSSAVRKQHLTSDGVMGFSMLAEPLRVITRRCQCGGTKPRSMPSLRRTRTIS